jgi:hypothetical protein
MFNQKLQYLCKRCGTVLKELDTPIYNVLSNEEECPTCRSLLSSTLIKRNYNEGSLLFSQLSQRQEEPLPKFGTAYEINKNNIDRLGFDIKKLDNLVDFSNGDRGCIVGNKKYTNMVITRLCVRALIPKRIGGFDSPNIIVVDAGNNLDFYLYVNFARQYGLDIKNTLQQIIISRAFTVYQLANLVINEIPSIIQRYNSKIVIISNFLEMFLHDPQLDIKEAEYLIREIKYSLTKSKTLQDILVLMSWNHNIHQQSCRYNNILSSIFGKRIEITNYNYNNNNNNNNNNNKTDPTKLFVNVYNNYAGKSIKRSQVQLDERDLKIVHTK